MPGQVTIGVNGTLTWVPIVISLIALIYSRRAYRFQVVSKKREQIAIVSLYHLKGGQDPGVVIGNPAGGALHKARIVYHDRRYGRFIDVIEIRGKTRWEHTYPSISWEKEARRQVTLDWLREQDENEKSRRQERECLRSEFAEYAKVHGRSKAILLFVAHAAINFPLDFLYEWRLRRKRRRSYRNRSKLRRRRFDGTRARRGEWAVAEAFIVDGAGEEWYLNTGGRKYYVPRRGLRRGAFFGAYRLRMIGYPFWSDFNYLSWLGLVIVGVDILLIWDHYFNYGSILYTVATTIG